MPHKPPRHKGGFFYWKKPMARNSSGVYSPPAGTSPLLPSTLADATKLETRLSDIGLEITGSLPRNGTAAMTAPLILPVGSLGAPGLGFAGDTDTGFAVISGRLCLIKDGVIAASMDADDLLVPLAAAFSGAVTFNGSATFNGALTSSATTGAGLVPPGSMMHFGGASAPSGWLFTHGQAVSRTTYAALFSAIGTTFGAGDGSTTFNLPDGRGRVLAGLDNMGGTSANRLTGLVGGVNGDVLGAVGGSEAHVLTAAQLAAHTHGNIPTTANVSRDGWGVTGSAPSGSVAISSGRIVTGSGLGENAETLESIRASGNDQSVTLTGSVSTGSSGSGEAHNNVQPTLILPIIIKT
jgi:microcystin-dependent protein